MISWRIVPLIFSLARGSTWNYGHCYERMENVDTCNDPEHWGSHYDACRGESQSPIDISDPVEANLGRIKFTNFAKYFNDIEIENNGHSLQLNKLNKGFFRLLQPKISGMHSVLWHIKIKRNTQIVLSILVFAFIYRRGVKR